MNTRKINVILKYPELYCGDFREDEHQLIAQYCQSLNGGESVPVPRSPVQVMVAIDQEQREELEAMIR